VTGKPKIIALNKMLFRIFVINKQQHYLVYFGGDLFGDLKRL